MVTSFVDAVRECLKVGGYAKKEHEVERGGVFLVGHRGRLFLVESDYQVGESLNGYEACGCAEQTIQGVFYATKGTAPDKRMQLALCAAEHHSAGVRGPFSIVVVPRSTRTGK
jgi:hypothetical protein